jgi:hypothetical protein
MSKDRIDSTNLHITDAQVEKGKIKKLEVNGKKLKIGNSDRVEPNKVTTIDVSEYTSPIETEPDFGFDAMAKNTIMLENIPSEIHSFTLYGYISIVEDEVIYFPTNTPKVGDSPLRIYLTNNLKKLILDSDNRVMYASDPGDTVELTTSTVYTYAEEFDITINF